jgi:drug/metabolite transporter (DMT)-like permease
VLPVFAIMLAVERIGAGHASLASMIGPVSTILLAFVFLGESFSGWHLVGTTLVLAGIAVLSRQRPAPGVSGISVRGELSRPESESRRA